MMDEQSSLGSRRKPRRGRIPIGVIGLGFGAHMIEHQILAGSGSNYVRLAALCDELPERLDPLAQLYNVPAYRELDELLARDDIPAVALFSGPVGRAGLIRRIIRAGKDVMTTKPFELDPTAARDVLEEAERRGRIVHLNSPSSVRSDDLELMDRWAERYSLGHPVAARHECWYWSPQRADGSWYDDPVRCPVAPILRLGIYGVNDLVRVLGEPSSVQVAESRIMTNRPTPDLAMAMISFASGAIAETLDGWCLSPPRGAASLAVFFEGGIITRNALGAAVAQESENVMHVFPRSVERRLDHDARSQAAEVERIPGDRISHAYRWDAFHAAVVGDCVDHPTPHKTIVDGVRVIDAMARASTSGRTERVR